MIPCRRILPSIREILAAKPIDKDMPFTFRRLPLLALFPFLPHRRSVNDFLGSCDAVLIRNEFVDMAYFFLVAPKHLKKCIVTIFATLSYPTPSSVRTRLHNFFYLSKFYCYLLGKCGAVVVSNHRDRLVISSLLGSPRRIFHIPYGLTEGYFSFGKQSAGDREFILSYVGRFEDAKGVDYLPSLIQNLFSCEGFKNFTLRIAGSGPQQYIVESLVSRYPNVQYLGFLNTVEMQKLYDEADVLIVPSRWETFSYVTLEAQSRGTLVVSFDVSGPNEIIVNEKSGIIVPRGRVDLLADAVLCLYKLKLNAPKKYWEMQKFAFEHARTNYSLDNTVNQLEQVVFMVSKDE